MTFADHLDLLNVNTNSPERVQRWRLILEEYGVHLKYIKGDDNIVADAFSRMEIHKVSKKELQQQEALKILNAMRISNNIHTEFFTPRNVVFGLSVHLQTDNFFHRLTNFPIQKIRSLFPNTNYTR